MLPKLLKNSLPLQLRCHVLFSNKPIQSAKKITHTGQSWDRNDYRSVRFSMSEKQVNKNFAQDFINNIAPFEVEGRIASCDGGGGPLGHPKVYMNLDQPGNHTCGYCGLRFVKKDVHGHH